ncbi:MAG: LrgB family protein [Burkholderiales bacterium]|nr:MAG: LrgB family protein [Burkholderiales bacterium]
MGEMIAILQQGFGLVLLTIVAFLIGQWAHRVSGGFPLFTPLLVGIALTATVLIALDIPYELYQKQTALLHSLLAPATVALALPIYQHRQQLMAHPQLILFAVFFGSVSSISSALMILKLLGASHSAVLSMVPKSVTTPIAMQISQTIGGIPSITAMMVILTGAVGYCLGPVLFRIMGVNDPIVRGIAYGTSSNVLGIARATEESELTAAFAALCMAINGLITAIAIPSIYYWFYAAS